MFLCGDLLAMDFASYKSVEELAVEKGVVLSYHGLPEDFRVGQSRQAATRGRIKAVSHYLSL